MCGIYGWFGEHPHPEKLESMGQAIRHRGPDGHASHSTPSSSIGSCRLSIVDKANGKQPFFNQSKSIAVVCNGEIYNHLELRQELKKLGYQFHTNCDIEVLPHAWEAWGIDMLQKLNGMFTIAIQEQETLTIARDRCGQKPLYLTQAEGTTHFASEIRALLAAKIPAKINRDALIPYLIHRYVPEPQTMFQGITTLPAGHFIQLSPSNSNAKPQQWWKSPRFHPIDISETEAIAKLDDLVTDSVSIALQGEEKIATNLSAGVDSSLLIDTIKKSGRATEAFTAGFGSSSDEINAAAALAKKLNIPHHPVICTAEDLNNLHKVVGQMELPIGDPLILAFDKLSSATAEKGFRVAIGGDGIDETMLGYSFQKITNLADHLPSPLCKMMGAAITHTPLALLNKCSPLPGSIGKAGRQKVGAWISGFHQSSDWQKAVGLRTLFTPQEAQRLLPHHQWAPPILTDGDSILEKQALFQFKEWLQDWAIIRHERNSMAYSIEYRIPFLDHRIIDFTASLPTSLKLNKLQGKYLWRKLAQTTLPKSNASRKKQPFYFPLDKFHHSLPFKQLVEDCLSPATILKRQLLNPEEVANIVKAGQSGSFLDLKKMMALIILELWQRNYID